MSPHGGARGPREEAGRRGAGSHLSMGILVSKSCQRSPGRKCGSVDCCHRQRGDKRGSEHAVFRRETNLCVSRARHPGSLRRSLRQRAFNRKKKKKKKKPTNRLEARRWQCARGRKITTSSTNRTFGPQLSPAPVNMSVESYSSLDESSLRALVSA